MVKSSKCEWCSKEFTPKLTSKGRFCCQKCANSWVANHNKERRIANITRTARKKSEKGEYKRTQTEAWVKGYAKSRETARINREAKWLSTPTENLSRNAIKKRLLIEQNNKCALCARENFWEGKELVLELDHINGDNKDNKRENLRLLCPNCHSQTPTFRKPKFSKRYT